MSVHNFTWTDGLTRSHRLRWNCLRLVNYFCSCLLVICTSLQLCAVNCHSRRHLWSALQPVLFWFCS